MRNVLLLCALLSTSAYAGLPAPSNAAPGRARSIQQLGLGQAHLPVIPIDASGPRMRLRLGGALGGGLRAPREASGEPEQHTAPVTGHGAVGIRLGSVELGFVFDQGLIDSQGGEVGAPEGVVRQYAFRFRANPGRGLFFLGMSFELGTRVLQATVPGGCRDADPNALCTPHRRFELGRSYFATTISPTFKLSESLYIAGGLGVSSGDHTDVNVDLSGSLDGAWDYIVYTDDDAVVCLSLGAEARLSERFTGGLTIRQMVEGEANPLNGVVEGRVSFLF